MNEASQKEIRDKQSQITQALSAKKNLNIFSQSKDRTSPAKSQGYPEGYIEALGYSSPTKTLKSGLSTIDKAMNRVERTLTSDQKQDLEDQRMEEASPAVQEFTLPEPKKKLMKLNFVTSSPPSGKKRSVKEIQKDKDNEKRNKLRERSRVVRDEDESNHGLDDNQGAFHLDMSDAHALSLE
jgi:hypothetical protein